MTEIWRQIPGYENLYEASTFGRIKSVDRLVPGKHPGTYAKITGKILSPIKNKGGYLRVNLCDETGRKAKFIHRLVALTFLGPPDGDKTDVNHKDENTQNNRIDNLEWCTKKYNSNYGNRNKKLSISTTGKKKHYSLDGYRRMVAPKEKAVIGINIKTGNKVYFQSMVMAGKHGFNSDGISHCVTGRQKTHRGYVWRLCSECDRKPS